MLFDVDWKNTIPSPQPSCHHAPSLERGDSSLRRVTSTYWSFQSITAVLCCPIRDASLDHIASPRAKHVISPKRGKSMAQSLSLPLGFGTRTGFHEELILRENYFHCDYAPRGVARGGRNSGGWVKLSHQVPRRSVEVKHHDSLKNQKTIFAIPQRPGINTQTWSCETGSREAFSFWTELDVYLTIQHY